MTRVAFYGSSLLSSYWNGAATYYRGMIAALAQCGYDVTFFEPDAFERQAYRDIEPPEWANSVVYPATEQGVLEVLAASSQADVVVKASGVGVFDDELLAGVIEHARPDALVVYWDVDAPATIAAMQRAADHPLRRALPALDLVLTYGGGQPVVEAYAELGARRCVAIYNALDPASHCPVAPELRYTADLSFLANRLPDREARTETFFFAVARRLPERGFLLGGSGWQDKPVPPNVRLVGHVPTDQHNAFNCSGRAILNVARDSMARFGFSPATRIFEAAGAGACLITDAWDGVELFLNPGDEILVARDGQDVATYVRELNSEQARVIGERARRRILNEHTYERRAAQVDALLAELLTRKRREKAA